MEFLNTNEPNRKEYERLAEKASAQAAQDREFFLKQIELDRMFFREKIDLLFSLHTILGGVLSLVTIFFGVVGYQNLTQFREASKQELTNTLNTYQQEAKSELSTTSTNALSEFDSRIESNIEQKLEGPKAKEFFDSSIERLGRRVFEPQIQALNQEIETMVAISRYSTRLANIETATRGDMRALRRIASAQNRQERTRRLAKDQLDEVEGQAKNFTDQRGTCSKWYERHQSEYLPSERRVLNYEFDEKSFRSDLETAKDLASKADIVCVVVLANAFGSQATTRRYLDPNFSFKPSDLFPE